jgi:hypothetical protein
MSGTLPISNHTAKLNPDVRNQVYTAATLAKFLGWNASKVVVLLDVRKNML